MPESRELPCSYSQSWWLSSAAFWMRMELLPRGAQCKEVCCFASLTPPSSPPLCCFFKLTPHSKHSLMPRRARWASEVDRHSGNLWELKNTHISNCEVHILECKLALSDPTNLLFPLDIYLRLLMAFPDRGLVCLYLISSAFHLVPSLRQNFLNGKPRWNEDRGRVWEGADLLIQSVLCWVDVVVISLVLVFREVKWHCQTALCLEQEPPVSYSLQPSRRHCKKYQLTWNSFSSTNIFFTICHSATWICKRQLQQQPVSESENCCTLVKDCSQKLSHD